MKDKYAIGVDYGTESGRVVLISLENGEEIAEHVTPYQHGVIESTLPHTTIEIAHNWALQHPKDYVDVLTNSIPKVLEETQISKDNIIGLGVDFTSCTMLPVDEQGMPLCYQEKWKSNPHSWVKLWKHHGAQEEANELNALAEQMNESFLPRYGGKISSEWMLPKILQIYREAKDVYDHTDRFVEAADWIVFMLTGQLMKNSCGAGYKSIWHKQEGYPDAAFLKALEPGLEDLITTKLRGDVYPLGTKAGNLTKEMAERTGLSPDLAVAVGVIDAHASVPAMGVVEPGKMVISMGTSICHMVLSEQEALIEGISGVVEDGIIPGLYGYEAGQPAGGDMFAWYVHHGVPSYVAEEAKEENKSIHQLLEEKAATYRPGETGLLALDWWNGNRSTLVNADLSGLILGLTLQTKPEEIYRALIESLAFGTRKVIDTFHHNGVKVNELYACGGLAIKNKLLMQVLSDITNRVIRIADTNHTPAFGAAMFGAVAAGEDAGGFDTIIDAAKHMERVGEEVFYPNEENVKKFDALYEKYIQLYNYFGKENTIMEELASNRSK